MCGRITPPTPSDTVSQSAAVICCIGLVICNSKSAHLLRLQRDKWYKWYKIHWDSINFELSLWPWPYKQQCYFQQNNPAYYDVPSNYIWLQRSATYFDHMSLLYKETGMQKWAGMLVETGKAFVDPSAMMTQMREDSDFWSLPPLTILCRRTHLVITRHPENGHGIAPNGQHHNQIDYILVRKRFRSGVNIAGTRSFPGADVGSDHDLLKMTFRLCLKRIS